MDELERRFNALISDEPQAINPDEERMNDLNEDWKLYGRHYHHNHNRILIM